MKAVGLIVLVAGLSACRGTDERVAVPGHESATKSSATVRAQRRAYDGAPPVVPHKPMGGMECVQCHNARGMAVDGLGFAPPTPHDRTDGLMARCQQCHVFAQTNEVFRDTSFSGLRQDLRRGPRAHALAPPVIPHAVQMRERCVSCHSGPAAREEIRTTHPERTRCRQCHVPATLSTTFARSP